MQNNQHIGHIWACDSLIDSAAPWHSTGTTGWRVQAGLNPFQASKYLLGLLNFIFYSQNMNLVAAFMLGFVFCTSRNTVTAWSQINPLGRSIEIMNSHQKTTDSIPAWCTEQHVTKWALLHQPEHSEAWGGSKAVSGPAPRLVVTCSGGTPPSL